MLLLPLIVALAVPLGAVPAGGSLSPAKPSTTHAPARPPEGGPGDKAGGGAGAGVIEMHVGIPGLAYIGQPLKEFRAKFPDAKVTAFANQKDAFVIQVPGSGISAYAVGSGPDDLKLASVGFILDQPYQGVSPGKFRSSKGIAKGSTVNDLLEAYGQPTQIAPEGPRPSPPSRRPQPGGAQDAPKRYQYTREDGAVTTYFVVRDNMVTRMVVNHLAPLDRYVLKHRPGEPPPASKAPPAGP